MLQQEQKPVPDIATIASHLRHITRRWGELGQPVCLELVFLSAEDHAKVKNVARFSADDTGLALAADHVESMNRYGVNAYAVVNPVDATRPLAPESRASAPDIVASFFHWADADSAQAAENIKNFVGPKCTFFVLTGTQPSLRPHVYWELDEPTRNLTAWNATQRAIAATLKTDPTVIDPPRIMRIAGSVNWPKPQKIAKGYIPEVTTLRIYSADERPPVESERMARAFAVSVTAPPQAPGGFQIDTGEHHGKTAEEYADILRRARTDGEKHGGVRDLAASLAGSGVPRHLAEAIVREACPVWDEGVVNLIDTAYAKFWKPKDGQYANPAALAAPQPIPERNELEPSFDTPKRAADLEWFDDVEPILGGAYLVKGLLDAGAMSVVYGPSNSGKTFFTMDLAYHVAIGATWRGRRVKQASVLYLAAEGGRGVINRVAALKQAHGVLDVPFAVKRAGLDLLHNQADLQHIVDLAAEVKAKLPDAPQIIVVDTLSRIMAGGDENSAADMTALIRNIDAIRELTSAHTILVHHTGKDTARGARGHSSLRAATDTEIEVANEDDNRAAMVTKQRDHQGGETFAFDLKSVLLGTDQDGDEVTSCTVEPRDSEEFTAAKKAAKGRGKNQQIIMEAFDQMVGEGLARGNPGGVGMPEPGQFWAVDANELRRIAQAKMVGDNTAKLFRQAWEALTGPGGLFVAGDNLAWRIDRRKK